MVNDWIEATAEPIAAGPLDRRVWGDVTCRRCGGAMLPGKAIAQTYGGSPDFAGGPAVTMSPEGPGRLIDCLKCERCGHSITPNVPHEGLMIRWEPKPANV